MLILFVDRIVISVFRSIWIDFHARRLSNNENSRAQILLPPPSPPPSLRKPNHRCPVTLHRPPQFFTTISSSLFLFLSIIHPSLDTFAAARVTQRPLNPRRSIELSRSKLSPSLGCAINGACS